jgi:DNA-binding transcriptional MerR regulator
MNMKELIARTGIAERQVRYLIAEGFLPPPRGGRSNADYGEDQVAGIRRYTRLRDLGFPPAAIKVLLEAKEGAPFVVAPGMTLIVNATLLGSGKDPRPLAQRIEKLLEELLKDGANVKATGSRRRQSD